MNKHDLAKEETIIEQLKQQKDEVNSERGLNNPVEDGTQVCPEQTTTKHNPSSNKKTMGVVYNTPQVKIRKEPNLTSEVKSLIPRDYEVEVSMKESTKEFYCVTLVSGVNGFCLKKFIKLKE